MGVKRVYVEKKPEFAVQAKELRHEVKSYLGIKTVKNVRVLIRYDVENLSDATFERACNGVFINSLKEFAMDSNILVRGK